MGRPASVVTPRQASLALPSTNPINSFWNTFWPKVRCWQHCHSSHLACKPNILPALLCPILAFEEPFKWDIVDCGGPLPRTKAGNQYLLTIMCASTRHPEAVEQRKITSVPFRVNYLVLYLRFAKNCTDWSRHKFSVYAFQTGPKVARYKTCHLQCITSRIVILLLADCFVFFCKFTTFILEILFKFYLR